MQFESSGLNQKSDSVPSYNPTLRTSMDPMMDTPTYANPAASSEDVDIYVPSMGVGATATVQRDNFNVVTNDRD